MMMPYMPLITSLVDAFLPDGDIEVSLDPESDPMKIPATALVNIAKEHCSQQKKTFLHN